MWQLPNVAHAPMPELKQLKQLHGWINSTIWLPGTYSEGKLTEDQGKPARHHMMEVTVGSKELGPVTRNSTKL